MSEVVVIERAEDPNPCSRTLAFRWDADPRPGQFLMAWAPGMEEIPVSLSAVGEEKAITVKVIGADTARLASLGPGDRMRVRGPYGNGYALDPGKRTLAVGGGIGIAPLLPVIRSIEADAVFAARDAAEVAYSDIIAEECCPRHWIATDDGSMGFHGNAVDLVRKVVSERRYDMVVACGPEVMLYYLHRFCMEAGLQCQMSLERHMKCGCGLCGSCMLGDRRVCADGPVFTGEQIAAMDEFGRSRRAPDGSVAPFRP